MFIVILYENGFNQTTVKIDAVSGVLSGELSLAIEASIVKPKSIAVVTSSTLIPYTGSSSDAISIAKNRSFYFKVTYEDNSVKKITSDSNLSFDCKYPYATIYSVSDNPGYFYIGSSRTSAQATKSTVTAYITAYYTENDVTVQTSFTLTIYNWVKSGSKSDSSLKVNYADGYSLLIASNAFYYQTYTGSTIFGWPSSATNVIPVFYVEREHSATLGNFYILDGTFGIPAFRFAGSTYSTSTSVSIYETK